MAVKETTVALNSCQQICLAKFDFIANPFSYNLVDSSYLNTRHI